MLNYYNCKFEKLAIHRVLARKKNEPSATVDPNEKLIEISLELEEKLKERLTDASSKESKAFKLDVKDNGDDSFFQHCVSMNNVSDKDFLEISKNIATKLALTQKRTNIPGGYLLVIKGKNITTKANVYIAIKAEPHEAFQLDFKKRSRIDVLKDIFLSPSQKLYKIGILFENIEKPKSSDDYIAILFDDQIKTRSAKQVADYFCEDFLGFTTAKNAKIQSKKFYEQTQKFIIKEVDQYDERHDLLNQLNFVFTRDTDTLVSPSDFSKKNFKTSELRDKYARSIEIQFDGAFEKDNTLISGALKRKKITFANDIYIIGPQESFDENVRVIKSMQELNQFAFDGADTLVWIKGKPFRND